MTLHKSQAERRRDILKAARDRFVADGYSRARLNDIAKDAGLSKGGVYFHFRSKREIFDALIDEDTERVTIGLQIMAGLQGSVADKITFFATQFLQSAINDPNMAKFQVVMGEMSLANAEIGQTLAEQHEGFVNSVAALLTEGIRAGDLRPDLNADVGARVLISVMDGLRSAIALNLHHVDSMHDLVSGGARLLIEGFLAR